MDYPKLVLRKGSEHMPRSGHPWIFSGAVAHKPNVESGAIVDVVDAKNNFVCRGTYNSRAMIRVRALTRNPHEAINEQFFFDRLNRAAQFRQRSNLYDSTNALRLIHGEADGLPGLIVDDYDGFLVVQFHTLGMERVKETVLDGIETVFKPKGLFERSDVGTRRAEGLKSRPTGPLRGDVPPQFINISEHEVQLLVDLYRGQKTGFFLDQRANRLQLQNLAQEADVLNLFAYSSAFSAHALKGGARRTLDIDISLRASQAARHNLKSNYHKNTTSNFIVGDVFDFIDRLVVNGPQYDIVVVDPPSLVRKRDKDSIKRALGIYTKLNRNALRLVRDNGFLITASCSTPISNEDFSNVIKRASSGARVQVCVLNNSLHSADHPVDPHFPEGRYLKCLTAQVRR